MSNPKEKAEQLIGKCYDTFVNDEDEHYTGTAWRLSKQCALVAVDEMISADWFIPTYKDKTQWETYWIDVKNEINKL